MVENFSKNLAYLRKERRLSQRDAAKALDVFQSLLSHYENGLREPGLDFVLLVSEFYSVTTDFLLGKTNHKINNDILTPADKQLLSALNTIDKKLKYSSVSELINNIAKTFSD